MRCHTSQWCHTTKNTFGSSECRSISVGLPRLVHNTGLGAKHDNSKRLWGKSFADDLARTGYCKRQSGLAATIRWDSALVRKICINTHPGIPPLSFAVFATGGVHCQTADLHKSAVTYIYYLTFIATSLCLSLWQNILTFWSWSISVVLGFKKHWRLCVHIFVINGVFTTYSLLNIVINKKRIVSVNM